MRTWLRTTFFEKAFSALQKARISESFLRTKFYSGDEWDEDAVDRVFLLSYEEATNRSYGFNYGYLKDEKKSKKTTAYAMTFAGVGQSDEWWLRTIKEAKGNQCERVNPSGDLLGEKEGDRLSGVVPALKFVFDKEAKKKAVEAEQRRIQAWQNSGLCSHCGGKFKGLFTKTCKNCGRKKDY